MAKSKSCKIATEQCDIAEAVYISNYRRNAEHHMAQVIPHPKFDFVPHRKAKNKKLVEKADKALEQVWNRLEKFLMDNGEQSFYAIGAEKKMAGLAQDLGALFKGAPTPETLTANPKRTMAVANQLNKLLDETERRESDSYEPKAFWERFDLAWAPAYIQKIRQERFGIISSFFDECAKYVEAIRTLGSSTLRSMDEAEKRFDKYFSKITRGNQIVDESMVMDGFVVFTNNPNVPEVKFLGTVEKDGLVEHKVEDSKGQQYFIPKLDIDTGAIFEGLKNLYKNELVNEIMSGDVRHITFSDNPTKKDQAAIARVLSFARAKKKLADKGEMEREKEGRISTYKIKGITYKVVMVKNNREGENTEKYKAFIVAHTDSRTKKTVNYYTKKGKIRDKKVIQKLGLKMAEDVFSGMNGFHRANEWRAYGPALSRNRKPIPGSTDKQPVFTEDSMMENQPDPAIVGESNYLKGDNLWAYIADLRNSLESFADNIIVPMKERNNARINKSKRILEKNPKIAELLGYDPSREGSPIDQVLQHFDLDNALYTTKDGAVYTKNSFFNKKKNNYFPWMWHDTDVLEMLDEAMNEVKARIEEVEMEEEQEEGEIETLNSLKSVYEIVDKPSANYEDGSNIKVGAQTAMTKHRKMWTDPSRRRKDGKVLKDYVDSISYGMQAEALYASMLESIIELAMSAKGKEKATFENEIEVLHERMKLSTNDPTAKAFIPLIGSIDINLDAPKMANLLNGWAKITGSKKRFGPKEAQDFILFQRGLTSAGLLGAYGAFINRTQTINTFYSKGWDMWNEGWKIMGKNYEHTNEDDLRGMDWKSVIDATGIDELVSAFSDALSPASEVTFDDRAYSLWGQAATFIPGSMFIPAPAFKRFMKMKWWEDSGSESFIDNGDPDIDRFLLSLDRVKRLEYRQMRKTLESSGTTKKDAKKIVSILKTINEEYGSEKNYMRKRKIGELRKLYVDLLRTPKDNNKREVLESKFRILLGEVSKERLEKMVSYKLSFWFEGFGDKKYLTFTEGEREMRQHAAITHLLAAYRSGALGKKGKKIPYEVKMPDGSTETRFIYECFTTDEAIRIARNAVRNEYFGMTKVHMGHAFAGMGDSIFQYKGYPLQQSIHDWRAVKSLMGGGGISKRMGIEIGNILYEKANGIKYNPLDPNVDEDIRALMRLITTRGMFSAIGVFTELFAPVRYLLGGANWRAAKNIMSGAENPVLKIAFRSVTNGLIMMALDDEERAMRGWGYTMLEVMKLFLPLWMMFMPLQMFYAWQDAKPMLD